MKDRDQSKQRDIVFAFDKYASPIQEQETKDAVARIRDEILNELNINTLPDCRSSVLVKIQILGLTKSLPWPLVVG